MIDSQLMNFLHHIFIIRMDKCGAILSATTADLSGFSSNKASVLTTAGLFNAIGKKAGEELNFGGLLGKGPVMPLRKGDPSVFINRGGRLPAPLQALKN